MVLIQFLLLTLADVLVKMAMDRTIKAALPAIYRRLDDELPDWLVGGLTPEAVSGRVAKAVSDLTGKSVSAEQVNAIARLYDPRQAVANAAAFLR